MQIQLQNNEFYLIETKPDLTTLILKLNPDLVKIQQTNNKASISTHSKD